MYSICRNCLLINKYTRKNQCLKWSDCQTKKNFHWWVKNTPPAPTKHAHLQIGSRKLIYSTCSVSIDNTNKHLITRSIPQRLRCGDAARGWPGVDWGRSWSFYLCVRLWLVFLFAARIDRKDCFVVSLEFFSRPTAQPNQGNFASRRVAGHLSILLHVVHRDPAASWCAQKTNKTILYYTHHHTHHPHTQSAPKPPSTARTYGMCRVFSIYAWYIRVCDAYSLAFI